MLKKTLDAPEVDHRFRRWFNDTPDRMSEARKKGYAPVLENGLPVRRLVGTDPHGAPLYAVLMDKDRVDRFIRSKWWQQRSLSVQARIRRLNPRLGQHDEGQIPRGWHPKKTLREKRALMCVVGKGEFIRRYGRAAFETLPKEVIRRDGKRVCIDELALEYERFMQEA